MILLTFVSESHSRVEGITGPTFQLKAMEGYIRTPDGNSIYMWGYAEDNGMETKFQYPGPTLLVNEGDTVTITLTNNLTNNTSMIFPGQSPVTSSGGFTGLVAQEAAPGGAVTYSYRIPLLARII